MADQDGWNSERRPYRGSGDYGGAGARRDEDRYNADQARQRTGSWGEDYGSQRRGMDRDYGAGEYQNADRSYGAQGPGRGPGEDRAFQSDRDFGRSRTSYETGGREGSSRFDYSGGGQGPRTGGDYNQAGAYSDFGEDSYAGRLGTSGDRDRGGLDRGGYDRGGYSSRGGYGRGSDWGRDEDRGRMQGSSGPGGGYGRLDERYDRSGYGQTGERNPDAWRYGGSNSGDEAARSDRGRRGFGEAFGGGSAARGGGFGRSDFGRDERYGPERYGAEDRSEGEHRGRGPKGYMRSDERIHEEVNDKLTDDPQLDATHIRVEVSGGEVTLHGFVESRGAKRRAEDLIENLSGVKHVQNNLRVHSVNYNAANATAGQSLGAGPATGGSQTGQSTGSATSATTGGSEKTLAGQTGGGPSGSTAGGSTSTSPSTTTQTAARGSGVATSPQTSTTDGGHASPQAHN